MSYTSIFFGTVDSTQIESEITAYYTQLTGRTPNPSDPEFQIIATIAYARILRLQDAERAGKSLIPRFATGINLDYLFELIGGSRKPAQASVTRITFTLDPARGMLVIPGGFAVGSTDGQVIYTTNESVNAPYDPAHAGAQLVNTITIDCTCTKTGSSTNGYATNTITTILSPIAGVLTATNIDVTNGGADTESDADMYDRWIPTLKANSCGGSAAAYSGLAYNADSTIVSVKVIGPQILLSPPVLPGQVEIRVLCNNGAPSTAILNQVLAACNADENRPMTDTVHVLAAQPVTYSLTVGIEVIARSPAATNIVECTQQVQAAIQGYLTLQSLNIGYDVVADKIIEVGMSAYEGVKSLDLGAFTTRIVDDRHYATCTALSVSVTQISEA